VDGWLHVVQEAQQDTRCYLTLPKPSLQHGRQILAHVLSLMPRVTSINDFKPQKMGGKTKVGKLKKGKVVDVTEEAIEEAISEGLSK
jgi:exosome complex RNA-binding protein Rrp4